MRELEELEAIHEDEELITLDDETASFEELLLDPSLELRMTLCDELLTSLRELEEHEAINEEDELITLDDETASLDELEAINEEEELTALDDDTPLLEEDFATLDDDLSFCVLDELFTSLRELEDS